MNDSTGNKLLPKKYISLLLLTFSLLYGCEEKKLEEQQIDPKNLFKFILKDVNPNSKSYNSEIGPTLFKGKVAVYYFGEPG